MKRRRLSTILGVTPRNLDLVKWQHSKIHNTVDEMTDSDLCVQY